MRGASGRFVIVMAVDLQPDVNLPIATARLRLEPQVAAHAPLMIKVLANPRIHRYIPSEPPGDEETLRQRYARLESRRSSDGTELWLNWTVFRENEVLGTVQASVKLATRISDVAYVFHPSAWGQGYASEAMQALLRFLQDDLDVVAAVANIDTRNASSQRLVERLGFVRTSKIQGADEFKGAVSDEFVYKLMFETPCALAT